jgi:fatty acid desaturase
VGWKRLVRKITPVRIVTSAVLLAGFYLLLIASFGFFQHWPYFRFFLLCVMGFAFLFITYLLKR